MADLRTIGLWVAAYGLLLAAATRRADHPLPTPARVWARFRAWVDQRRATTGGTVVVGAGAPCSAGPYWSRPPRAAIVVLHVSSVGSG